MNEVGSFIHTLLRLIKKEGQICVLPKVLKTVSEEVYGSVQMPFFLSFLYISSLLQGNHYTD